jgi:hypothetical protein
LPTSIESFHELVIGERVRIRSGVMSGVEGTLVRKGESMRFVLTLDLINQHAAIQVDADSLEPSEPERRRGSVFTRSHQSCRRRRMSA